MYMPWDQVLRMISQRDGQGGGHPFHGAERVQDSACLMSPTPIYLPNLGSDSFQVSYVLFQGGITPWILIILVKEKLWKDCWHLGRDPRPTLPLQPFVKMGGPWLSVGNCLLYKPAWLRCSLKLWAAEVQSWHFALRPPLLPFPASLHSCQVGSCHRENGVHVLLWPSQPLWE